MKKGKVLIVTKLDKDKIDLSFDPGICHTYNFGNGRLNRGTTASLNNAKKLHQFALKEKGNYVDFIYSTNKSFLKHDIIFNQNLSLYFLSIHSNKRSEFFSTYTEYLHQLMLRDILNSNEYDTFYSIGFSKDETLQLENNLGIQFNTYIPGNYNQRKITRNMLNSFYLFSFVYLMVIKLLFRRRNILTEEFFIAQFPKHFNDYFTHKKYGSLVKKEKSLFLLTVLSDGFHQNLKPLSFLKAIIQLLKKSNRRRYILLDRYLSWKDFFGAIRFQFDLKKKLQKLKEEKYVLNGIDLSHQLHKELRLAAVQIPRLLFYFNAYRTVFDQFSPQKVTYYLHEFVSGRFISYVLNTYYPKITSIGFQHGPIAELKLLYALSPKEVINKNYLHSVPLPQQNFCENEEAKTIYHSYGYPNLEVLTHIERLIYLKAIKREAILKDTCLVACGLHDAALIMQYIIQNKIYQKKKVWFKLHPMTRPKSFQKQIKELNTPNISLAQKPLPFYLEKTEEVIATYSSVGEEAINLGIKTTLLVFDYTLNESPLMNKEIVHNKLTINYISN